MKTAMFILQPVRPDAGEKNMATYTQTLLMPLPRKHVRDVRQNPRDGRGIRGAEYGNRNNQDINSILSFFE